MLQEVEGDLSASMIEALLVIPFKISRYQKCTPFKVQQFVILLCSGLAF